MGKKKKQYVQKQFVNLCFKFYNVISFRCQTKEKEKKEKALIFQNRRVFSI